MISHDHDLSNFCLAIILQRKLFSRLTPDDSSATRLELDSSLLHVLHSSRSPFFARLCNRAASPLLCAVSDWSNVPPPLRSARAGADAADSWHRASAERGRQAGPATGAASCVSAAGLFKYRTAGCHCRLVFAASAKKRFHFHPFGVLGIL